LRCLQALLRRVFGRYLDEVRENGVTTILTGY
jgi:hypothetical protein